MKNSFLADLVNVMKSHGFSEVAGASNSIPNVALLLKRQNWNTNRSIVVVTLPEEPNNFAEFLMGLRKSVAFKCGFFPFFWGIGIQAVVVAPGFVQSGLDPKKHVALVDNQWAIIQSIFLVDPAAQVHRSARTWGQFVTGKFQDSIQAVLSQHFQAEESQIHDAAPN
jgi:hypothetical protein